MHTLAFVGGEYCTYIGEGGGKYEVLRRGRKWGLLLIEESGGGLVFLPSTLWGIRAEKAPLCE